MQQRRQPDPRALDLIVTHMKAWFNGFDRSLPSAEGVREQYRRVYHQVMGGAEARSTTPLSKVEDEP